MPINERINIFSIYLIIHPVSLVQPGDLVGIIQGDDCKFYTTVTLQMCKFTYYPMDAKIVKINDLVKGWSGDAQPGGLGLVPTLACPRE